MIDLSDIFIRDTVPEDAEELLKIQKAAFKPLFEKYHDAGSPYLRGVDDILIRLTDDYRHFTVFKGGRMTGGIFYRLRGKRAPEVFLEEGEYYLGRIYISPEFQGMGIGSSVIRLCDAKFTDAKAFYVDFPSDMDKNRRCYEKAGYSDTGEKIPVGDGLTLTVYKQNVKKGA
ncbi:MAG: GNAT family N-acetyltransferase [Clostridia bacterium]|nr:GNAT family N-acetyltransferase [Clostridia bacterium]